MADVKIRVCAPTEYVVNVLTKSGVKIKKLKVFGRECEFCVSGGDFSALKRVLGEQGREVSVVSDGTFCGFIKKNALRIGLYLGLIMTIAVIFFYSSIVTRVQIYGNSLVADEIILSALESVAELPLKKDKIDKDLLERTVISLEGISSASVEIRGNTVLINVYEELPKAEMPDMTDFTDITSLYDGVITRIIVYSGTAAVKKGDPVRKGQVLISSDVVIDEEKGLVAKEKPLGDVYATVWVTKTLIYEPTTIVRRRTGRTERVIKFFAPEKEYKGEFATYEVENKSYYLDGIAPFKVFVTTYYEVEEVEEAFDFDKNKDGIIKEATERMEEELPSDCVKNRTWYEIKRLDKSVALGIYYEIEIKIN